MIHRNSFFTLIIILIAGLLALISSDLQTAFSQTAVSASPGSNSSSQTGTAIVALSPDGNTLARVDQGTQITVWDLVSGQQKLALPGQNNIN